MEECLINLHKGDDEVSLRFCNILIDFD